MAERGQHQIVRSAGDAGLERLIDAYTDVVWYTLYAHAPSRAPRSSLARKMARTGDAVRGAASRLVGSAALE